MLRELSSYESSMLSLSLRVGLSMETPLTVMMSMTAPPSRSVTPAPGATLSGCETAFAYCEDRSTCFIGSIFVQKNGNGGGPWGWNVDLGSTQLDDKSKSLTCAVYAGAGQCNLRAGTNVGNITFRASSVTWDFKPGVAGTEFHLYTGVCPFNDGGSGVCLESDMVKNARTPGQYTLVADTSLGGTYETEFSFSSTNYQTFIKPKSLWAGNNYHPFPIGASGYHYVTAHATVCPFAEAIDVQFTTSPTIAPPTGTASAPTAIPSAAHGAHAGSNQADHVKGSTGNAPSRSSAGATAGFVILAAAIVIASAFLAYKRFEWRDVSSSGTDSGTGM